MGLRSVLDDNAHEVVAYGLPGIASNKTGDIAVVYGRSSPKMFMETRFSTWLHNEIDIRPSRELQKGKAPDTGIGLVWITLQDSPCRHSRGIARPV